MGWHVIVESACGIPELVCECWKIYGDGIK